MFRTDHSGPRQSYFLALQKALQTAGISAPCLVLDRQILLQNIAQLKADLPASLALRIVAKSLPVPEILTLVRQELNSHRFMTFNGAMLHQVAALDPKADQLLGKPLPVAAAARFFDTATPQAQAGQIHWLIDSTERLQAYNALAEARGEVLNIALELDVGLHRGGFAPGPDLAAALHHITDAPLLRLSGFMGYEAHLAKAPTAFGWRDKAHAKAMGLYDAALKMTQEITGIAREDLAVRNTAGSPTFRLHQDSQIANELAVGSALVKPTDFDTDLLSAYRPALFIASPALKVLPQVQIPILEPLDPLRRALNPNLARGIFIHGGYWKALPVDPPGLAYNGLYGRSSNQELLTGGAATQIAPDEFVFLRPTQSEAVLLQFGDIVIYDGKTIYDRWSPFSTSA